jgi:protein ImuB
VDQPSARLEVELPVPLFTSDDLLRAVRAKLERFDLEAPVRSVDLRLAGLTPAQRRQLDLSRGRRADGHSLPTLLGELSAWLGAGRVGVLHVADSHRPEAQSSLVPVVPGGRHGGNEATSMSEPTRLLAQPLYVGKLEQGQLLSIDRDLFVVDRLRLRARIDRVEWWTSDPVSRDYARAWIHTAGRDGGTNEHGEAWMFVDRATRRGYLHGWFE